MTPLERGRAAYDRREWAAARKALSEAAGSGSLGYEDLRRLALSSYLSGMGEAFVAAMDRAHHAALDAGDEREAARCAFWIGMHLANRGDMGQATGWFGRAGRLVDRVGGECAERGYLMLPVALRQVGAGEVEAAARTAGEAAAIAERYQDADLHALAIHVQGRALIGCGQVPEGLALMDEAMVAVATDELTPVVTGVVYCSVISACRKIFALGRAREWTAALTRWCERQPELVAYTGECLIYRAELLRIRGAWDDALSEAELARDRLATGLDPRTAALALYQQGEVLRLVGELDEAEAAFREVSRMGREPQPGLALLRLAQGDEEAATASIQRALGETRDPIARAALLPAAIEIALAAGRVDDARDASLELAATAEALGTEVLTTLMAWARGAVELAEGHAMDALAPLRDACRGWQSLDAPYDEARVRVLISRACAALGDDDAAELEAEAARSTFERLGATPELARLDTRDRAGSSPGHRAGDHGLTPRQLEVLTHLATGRTNRAIADALSISEKTVARHVEDIFARLGVSSRAAATAYAYEHGLVEPNG